MRTNRPKRNIRRGIPQRYKKEALRNYNEDILSLLEIIRFGNRYVPENNRHLTRDLFFASHTRITRQIRNRRNSIRRKSPRCNATRRIASRRITSRRITSRRVGSRQIGSRAGTHRMIKHQIGSPKNGSRRNSCKRKNSLQRNATPDEYYGNLDRLGKLGIIDAACQPICHRKAITDRNEMLGFSNNMSLTALRNCVCKKQTASKFNKKKIKNDLSRDNTWMILDRNQNDNVKIEKNACDATMCGCCPNTRILLGENYNTSFPVGFTPFMEKEKRKPLTPLPIPPIPIPEPLPQNVFENRQSKRSLTEQSTSAAAKAKLLAAQQMQAVREEPTRENVANRTENSASIENGDQVNDQPDVDDEHSETRIICRFSSAFPQPLVEIENGANNNINAREGDCGACGDGNHNDPIFEIQITLRSTDNITIDLEENDDEDEDEDENTNDEAVQTSPRENNQNENTQNGNDAMK